MRDMRTVVVGYDGSADGRRAVETAAELVAEGGTVHVVVAYRPMSSVETERLWNALPAEFRDSFDVLQIPRGFLDEAEVMIERFGIAHESHLIDAHPAEAILDTAEDVDADLVVVGSRGLGRAARFIRGSVSTRVANQSHASVLVVHAHEDGAA